MLSSKLVLLLGACAAIVACEESTSNSPGSTNYSAILNKDAEVPPTTAAATGTFSAALHPTNNTLSFNLTWTGLTSATAGGLQAHIHGPADPGVIANVLVDFRALPTGSNSTPAAFPIAVTSSFAGNINLASLPAPVDGDSLKKLLDAGKLYVNIHTTANSNGEIRGQITKQVSPQ